MAVPVETFGSSGRPESLHKSAAGNQLEKRASVAGGRGSFVATLLGAALVQATSSASSYIDANSSVHYAVIGSLTLNDGSR